MVEGLVHRLVVREGDAIVFSTTLCMIVSCSSVVPCAFNMGWLILWFIASTSGLGQAEDGRHGAGPRRRWGTQNLVQERMELLSPIAPSGGI